MTNKQTIVFNIEAEISQVKQSAQQMREIFDKMDLSDSVRRSFSNTFTKLEKEIRSFEVTANKGLSSLSDTKKAINNIDKINDLFENLKIQMKDTQKFKLDKIVSSDVAEKLKKYKSALEQIVNLQNKNNSNKIEKAEEAKAAALEKREEVQRKLNTSIEKTKSLNEEKTRISKQIEDETAAIDKLAKKRQELASIRNKTSEQQAEFSVVKADYEAVEKALIRHKNELKKNEDEISKTSLANKNLTSSLSDAENKFNSTVQKLEEAKRAGSITEEEFKNLKKAIAELDGSSADALPNNLQELEQKLRQLDPTGKILEEINSSFSRMASSATEAGTAIKGAGEKAQQAKGSFETLEKTNEQMDQLKSRLTYFFSAMNGIQLFKNAIRSAYESVKELDAAITEMAVVTDYSINDIWGNIPEYTRTATELGATTKDVINSMVLYTQQGLEMSQATKLSTQTMKMARIAGLEGAEATDLRKHWVFI